MICNKCNHRLPDDSEFCQYCGNKIEQGFVISPKAIEEISDDTKRNVDMTDTADIDIFDNPNIEDMTPDEVLKAVMESQARETIKAMEANEQNQPNHENESDFGLVPEKPIYTLAVDVVDGEKEYLNKLYTINGEKVKWNRQGSMSVDGINGIVDIYETYLPSGELYKTIYINMYGAKKSTKAPAGFAFKKVVKKPVQAYKTKKTTKTKFCSRCGSLIDSESKICTGCGKQYFKGFRLNKFAIIIIILSLIIITSVIVNAIQYNEINYLSEREADLESQISSLEDDVDYWETELSEVGWELTFYKNNAKIVGDDGSNKYHEYGCSDLDTSNGFWIFNTETAEARGHKKCPKCN